MFARAASVAVVGMEGYPVDVEVQVGTGLPAFTVVGLADTAIQESRERVRAAVQASGEEWPNRRLTVNLSPAHLPKTGSGFDLSIALGVLAAVGRIPAERLRDVCAVGELSLDGGVRRVRGAVAVVGAAAERGMRRILVPRANAAEAALIEGVDIIPLERLRDAVRYLRGEVAIDPASSPADGDDSIEDDADFSEVRGQVTPKRALEIAAAGGHNVLLVGPPGGGKTMLARRLPSILPPLERSEAMTVTRLYSVAGLLPEDAGLVRRRPFRAPHHSISVAGLVGGGSGIPMPGEISLAHRGVLFLDEASEFRRDALQALRQPIEDGMVRISRARVSVAYPSRCQVVLAANPCPCGHLNDQVHACMCAPGQITAYRARLSGPLLDRIDVRMKVERVGKVEIFGASDPDSSAEMRARVVAARQRQAEALDRYGVLVNADIPPRVLAEATRLDASGRRAVERMKDVHGMSMRGAHRVVRMARTIADLNGDENTTGEHIMRASQYQLWS